MTFRERIADWISGGALSGARFARDCAEDSAAGYEERWKDMMKQRTEYQRRCVRIAAEETTKANATVRRMAAIARGEK